MSLRCTFNRLMGGFIFFAILAIGQGVSAEITFDIIDDFEEVFVPRGSFGQIPTGWTVSGSDTVKYSKGNEAYNGLYGLHANAIWNPQYYGVLAKEAFNTGYSNETVRFSIRVKAQTSSQCSFTLLVYSGGISVESNLFWYSNTETSWRTAEFDFDVPSSGIVEDIVLIFGHDTPSGSSTFDVDYLTFDCPEAVYYRDVDGDGLGDPNDTTNACVQPEGYVLNNNDLCDDDPDKQEPGLCGCGIPDTDTDGDSVADCNDQCADTDPSDPSVDQIGCADSQKDCAGTPGGTATEDNCGTCDTDPNNDCTQDPILPGDQNNDGIINLSDVVLALQIITYTPSPVLVFKEADINGDGKIGLEEALYALQVEAGIRQ